MFRRHESEDDCKARFLQKSHQDETIPLRADQLRERLRTKGLSDELIDNVLEGLVLP